MAKIFVNYVDNEGCHYEEDYLDAGEAHDRADYLSDCGCDSSFKVEWHDGEGFVSEHITFTHRPIFDLSWEAQTSDENLCIGFGATTREALIDLLDSANETEKEYALSIASHKRWYNDRRKSYYIIVGVVRSCEAATWELLYKREEDAESNEYFRRPAWEWQQLNRDGNPRFVKA